MRKQKADALKQEFSGDNDQADALDFMSPELLKETSPFCKKSEGLTHHRE